VVGPIRVAAGGDAHRAARVVGAAGQAPARPAVVARDAVDVAARSMGADGGRSRRGGGPEATEHHGGEGDDLGDLHGASIRRARLLLNDPAGGTVSPARLRPMTSPMPRPGERVGPYR